MDEALRDDHAITEQLVQACRVAAVGRLASGIAHDLNNLLAAIVGAGHALREELVTPGTECAQDVEEILLAAQRARELVRHLTTFERRSPRAPDTVDLAEVLSRAERFVRRSATGGVRLETQVAQALWPVLGDAGHLEQVLIELVVNALEASSPGGRVHVALENAEASGRAWVRVRVSDRGCGMTPAVRARLEEPGFTTKGPGRGAGLAAVRRVVEACGGAVQLESTPGVGTTAELLLPRHA